MRPTIFEINDVGIRVARGTDEIVCSPGYASYVEGRIELGERGHAHAWLTPRHSSNRFWLELNTSPLHQFGKRVRHAGDLAYLHLELLRERAGNPKSAIFITPSTYQRAQLSLLLGVAQANGMVVTALVDSAAAVGASLSPGQYLYLEATLHQAVLTRIDVDAEATRSHCEVLAGCGMVQFEQAMLGCIVDAFLSRCRFDPLHDASTEQLLHTHLPEWLRLLQQRPEIAIAIDFRGTRHETRIHRDALTAATAPLVQQIERRVGGARLILDHRYLCIPGFFAQWPSARHLSPETVLHACAEDPELQAPPGNSGVSLRTSLACIGPELPVRVPLAAPSAPINAPSHLLINHVAYPLTAIPIYLAARGEVRDRAEADSVCRLVLDPSGALIEPCNGAQVAINGQTLVGSRALLIGDHLTIPGATSLFVPIRVQR
ncbi:MAG: hypothetical protein EXR86_12620 [Gammaproteobacteria bacterium]|nr:hypothetical protein [Gammaproteobacteria bacterium]